ncbi:helix-turn-helix transcriptional regulator [Acidovorax radicis]|uniref:helix-turn-helix transcriptional regulator n=1 Tax=Acidovorax radicis TaxID=758826 RepID=UPI001CFC0F40|nr:WYL domain-containing protein [Acidovorax radicis]UCV00869.1 WYL domain-containing protein [Acidovorax radicis]
MKSAVDKIRWGTERRLEFIEFRLYWEGGVRRGDITEKFGVSTPQASADLGLYQKLAAGNLVYDSSEKRYVSTEDFKPIFLDLKADSYLAHLHDASGDRVRLTDSWMGEVPSTALMPVPNRRVKSDVLRALIRAIREKRSIEILYQSMNKENLDKAWRWVSPHSLVNDGARWHVRAFCHNRRDFRDFLLSRCDATKSFGEAESDIDNDVAWNELFEVQLHPNPSLNEVQRRGVMEDYEMENGNLSIFIKKALLFYFEKNLRLDVPDVKGNPAATPLKILNYEEFKIAMSQS